MQVICLCCAHPPAANPPFGPKLRYVLTVKQLEDDSGLTVKINFLLEPLSRFRHMFFIQPPRGVRK